MTLRDQMTADFNAAFLDTSSLAETITYTPATGDAVEIPALIFRDPVELIDDDTGERVTRSATVKISQSDVAQASATAYVTFDDKDWDVVTVQPTDTGGWTLRVWRNEVVEKSAGVRVQR